MATPNEATDQIDQLYMPSAGGGVFSARGKAFHRRSTVQEKVVDVETVLEDEKDDGVDDERDFHKKQVRFHSCCPFVSTCMLRY
jgi:hypothetical protein